MRFNTLTIIVLLAICSCKKPAENTAEDPPPANLPDSNFQILSVLKKDINEYDLEYKIKPAIGDQYSDVYLVWSTSASFETGNDSVKLSTSVTNELRAKHSLTGLGQGLNYYSFIRLRHRNKVYSSTVKEWKVDSLKFTRIFYTSLFPAIAQRGITSYVRTNADTDTTKTYLVGTKVSIGSYDCPVTTDKGAVIYFQIPLQIPPGNYKLKLERKGIAISTPDSILVLSGFWSDLSTPSISVNGVIENQNAIMSFGKAQSATKAYIIGGVKVRPAGSSSFHSELSKELYVFDVNSNTWETKPILAPRNWENPHAFYHNNAIYIIGGYEQTIGAFFNPRQSVRNMWQLDVNTMTLAMRDTLPYSARFNPVSFQVNNEWYIGMGLDSAKRENCCGTPSPTYDFWKYNPSANQWNRVADFPGTHQVFPTTFTIGSKAYVFIGDLDPPNQELWEYNADENTWKRITIPINNGSILRGEKYSIVSFNQKIYMFTSQTRFLYGGGYGTTLDNIFIELDPISGQLKKINPNTNLGMVKPIFQSGARVIFQSDVLGGIEMLPKPNTTNLILE